VQFLLLLTVRVTSRVRAPFHLQSPEGSPLQPVCETKLQSFGVHMLASPDHSQIASLSQVDWS
jgi:hypothetical protein